MLPLPARLSNASWLGLLLLLVPFLSFIHPAGAADTKYVQYTGDNGVTVYLADDRRPALYTQNFGDCLGNSLINVTRFDAAYYKDNMTVLFHLEGNTAVANESLMRMLLLRLKSTRGLTLVSVHQRVCVRRKSILPHLQPMQCPDLQVDPRLTDYERRLMNYSLCPMNASVPIEANGIIPVSQTDVSGIPPLALNIPDFEGQAILRVFSNSTRTQIGCYSALVTNGATFSHPSAVGTILGVFAIVALIASFATVVYGDHIPTTRTHYAHSLSILVVFSVFHHIFFTGALSMNWPSVLVAFWSNFAWSAGMIYSQSMQNSINQLIGSNKGNTSIVGAAGTGSAAVNLGGGYSISQIYKRSFASIIHRDTGMISDIFKIPRSENLEQHLAKRGIANSTTGYTWYGYPVKPGLPLPGNFSGFPGTLAEEGIPASNAFVTGFLWFLILMVVVASAVIGFKWLVEGLVRTKLVKEDRLAYFRAHWTSFTGLVLLRTLFIGFFMMMFLTMFQFTYHGSAGVIALAVIVFVFFFIGLFGIAGYACFYRLRFGRYETAPDRAHLAKTKALGFVPWYGIELESHRSEKSETEASVASVPWWRIRYVVEDAQRMNVHEDEDYVKKFGWLSARYRRTRWWFFAAWLLYEFIRACFYGGAAGHPMTQVFGLLVVEFIALVIIVRLKPFEGSRLNALMVYILGFSKVASVALSAAFDLRFNLPRITTTVIGVVIIVIQGILTIILLVAILVGAISSYMSVTRNQEDFRPRKWAPIRKKYFAHMEKAATDLPPQPPPVPESPKEPYFNVSSVRRCPKIEDDDIANDAPEPLSSRVSMAGPSTHRASRADSLRSQTSYSNVPFGARVHRASWSSRDFGSWHEANNRNSPLMSRTGLLAKTSDASLREHSSPQRVRTPSRVGTGPLEVKRSRMGKGQEQLVEEGGNEELTALRRGG